MKKFFAILFLFVLMFSLAACGDDKDNKGNDGGSDDAEINFGDL